MRSERWRCQHSCRPFRDTSIARIWVGCRQVIPGMLDDLCSLPHIATAHCTLHLHTLHSLKCWRRVVTSPTCSTNGVEYNKFLFPSAFSIKPSDGKEWKVSRSGCFNLGKGSLYLPFPYRPGITGSVTRLRTGLWRIGVRSPEEATDLSPPKSRHRFWRPPNLLSSEHLCLIRRR